MPSWSSPDPRLLEEWNEGVRRSIAEYRSYPITAKKEKGDKPVPRKDKPTYEMLEAANRQMAEEMREKNAELHRMRVLLMRAGIRGPKRTMAG